MSKDSKENSGLATAAMVLGIIAIVGAWIPFLNVVSIILGALALIFGLIPLFKKRSIGKAVAGVVLGLAAIVISVAMISAASKVIGDAVNDATKQETKVAALNEAVIFDEKEVTVQSVERDWKSDNQFIAPEAGKEFVKVQVSIKNKSSQQVSYNTFDWKMKDSKGDIKDVASAAFSIDGALNSGELAATTGGKEGFLIFEVPSGDTELTLQYSPSFWTNKRLEIKL